MHESFSVSHVSDKKKFNEQIVYVFVVVPHNLYHHTGFHAYRDATFFFG